MFCKDFLRLSLFLSFLHIFVVFLPIFLSSYLSLVVLALLHPFDILSGDLVVHLALLSVNFLKDSHDLILFLFVWVAHIDLEEKTKFNKLLRCQINYIAENLVDPEDERKDDSEDKAHFAAVGLIRTHPCGSSSW